MRWKQFFTPVKNIEAKEAQTFIDEHSEGTYTLLDVRQPAEYEKSRIPGSKLIPVGELADRLGELDRGKPIIAYCAVGGRSRAASQLLSGQGFKKVSNLKGGIKSWQGHETSGPAEMGIVLLTGHETSEEVIILAYGLETGLKDFYTCIDETTDDPDVSELLGKLSKIEDNHRQRLFNLYASLVPGTVDQQLIETVAGSGILEGGFETDTFIEQNLHAMQTSVGVLDVAMMLETQAMDLYMRYAEKSSYDKAKRIFFDLANEEKGHLKRLGDLMNEKAA